MIIRKLPNNLKVLSLKLFRNQGPLINSDSSSDSISGLTSSDSISGVKFKFPENLEELYLNQYTETLKGLTFGKKMSKLVVDTCHKDYVEKNRSSEMGLSENVKVEYILNMPRFLYY